MEVMIICGPICSGKTTMKKQLEAEGYETVEIGSIVRKITQTVDRIQDASLDEKIIFEVFQLLDSRSKVALIGIRQKSILFALMSWTRWDKLHIRWLECDPVEAQHRYYERENAKDKNILYWEARARDEKLGLKDLEDYLKTTVSTYKGIDFQIINTDTNANNTLQEKQAGENSTMDN